MVRTKRLTALIRHGLAGVDRCLLGKRSVSFRGFILAEDLVLVLGFHDLGFPLAVAILYILGCSGRIMA